jgi:hypothetical protein
MEPIYVDLNFSDFDAAKALGDAKPPDGVRVSVAKHPTIRAAAGADIVLQVSFHISGPELAIVAAWAARELSQYLKKRRQKKARINDEEVSSTQEEVLRLMRDVIHWQQVRDAQKHESERKKLTDANKEIE